jgi:hypothetical protein
MFDESRRTFDRRKHYSAVRMQQGRVQLDSDWNEQAEIAAHRDETGALDAIGRTGAPMHTAGFRVVVSATEPLGAEEKGTGTLGGLAAGELAVTAGRYWVDGIFCENEAVTRLSTQPDRRGVPALSEGVHLVYLDVWRRAITYLDDPDLREVALGGPDTAGRLKTIWQVRTVPVECPPCAVAFPAAVRAQDARYTGRMRARDRADPAQQDVCVVPSSAGYRGLENQLYRIQVHDGGASRLATSGTDETIVTRSAESDHQVRAAGGTWTVDQQIEIYRSDEPLRGMLFRIRAVSGRDLTLDAPLGVPDRAELRARPLGATFKWALDNATTVARVIKRVCPNDARQLELERVAFDDARAFTRGLWVELTDDARELEGIPGPLFRVAGVDPARKTITLDADAPALDLLANPKLRQWHGVAGVKHLTSPAPGVGWIDVDRGVQIRFTEGNYRCGSHWTVPARAATADAQSGRVLWPTTDPDRAPDGIQHHYAPLAIVRRTPTAVTLVRDCRRVFAPLAELLSCFYLGGDGQEVMPDVGHPEALLELPATLDVGVAKGEWPVEGAVVRFRITRGAGELVDPANAASTTSAAEIQTGPGGVARCRWRLQAPPPDQADDNLHQVQAELVVDSGVKHLPITFSARRTLARDVAYDPGACPGLSGANNVQAALDAVARAPSLSHVGGDGQAGLPGQVLALPIEVLVRSTCRPMPAAVLRFSTSGGGGFGDTAAGAPGGPAAVTANTDDHGQAARYWRLGAAAGAQEALVELLDGATVVRSLRFTANALRAEGACSQAARTADELRQVLLAVPNHGDAQICLPPGTFELTEPIVVKGKGELKITGSGPGSRITTSSETALRFEECAGVTLRDLSVSASGAAGAKKGQPGALTFRDCGRVTVEHVALQVGAGPIRAAACLRVEGATRLASVRVRACDLMVGDGQVGILVTGSDRCRIEDNRLAAGGKPRPFRTKLVDPRFLPGVNGYLLFPIRVDAELPSPPNAVHAEFVTHLTVRARPSGVPEGLIVRKRGSVDRTGHKVTYEAPADLVPSWERLFKAYPKMNLRDVGYAVIKEWVAGAAPGKFLDDAFRKALDLLSHESDTVAAQGIVVGGSSIAREIRITDNTVRGFTQGIHVGQSIRFRDRRSERTHVAGNTIEVRLLGSHWFDRHGVFCGNATSTVIENNVVSVVRSSLALGLPLEGFRVIGQFGALLIVRQNHTEDCDVGYRVRAINRPRIPPPNPTYLWRVFDNAARGTFTPYDVVPPMP